MIKNDNEDNVSNKSSYDLTNLAENSVLLEVLMKLTQKLSDSNSLASQ
jgi:hypothetical protein